MPSKAYSKEQREEVRLCLLETALSMYSQNGIKKVRLSDILNEVGISKPFFYTFYDSVQEFVLRVLDFQWTRYDVKLATYRAQRGRPWQEQLRELLDQTVHYSRHGLLVMTQEEELWVRARLDDTRYEAFMERQVDFFRQLLALAGVSETRCPPKVLGNMVISSVLIYNSARRALPFLYLEELEPTARAQIDAIIAYLEVCGA